MPNYDVWMEGYSATGNYAPDRYMGEYSAKSFKGACVKAMRDHGFKEEDIKKYYDRKRNTFWGCRFFDHNPHHFFGRG